MFTEVTIEKVAAAHIGARTKFGCWIDVMPSDLTLIRRAPVDLATCDLPVEVMWTGERCRLEWRGGGYGAALSLDEVGSVRCLPIGEYRPLDAPAPRTKESAAVRTLESKGYTWAGGEQWRPPIAQPFVFDAPAPAQNARAPFLEAINASGSVRAMMRLDDTPLVSSVAKTLSEWAETDPERRLRLSAPTPGSEVGEHGVTKRKFYHTDWPMNQLLEARNGGLVTDDGEAWRYQFSHKDAKGAYDLLYRPLAVLPTPPGHIMIGGIAVPEPMREAPEYGFQYWVPCTCRKGSPSTELYTWGDSELDRTFMLAGLCHLTREAAETHARALIAVSGGVV